MEYKNIFRYRGQIKTRRDFGQFLNAKGLTNTSVEIGVRLGGFSKILLDKWDGKKHYMVDPWNQTPGYREYKDLDWDAIYRSVQSNFAVYGKRVSILRMLSEQAVEHIPNELDFAYIDGNHNYEFVLQDIRLWWAKVKQGGILAGHDLFFPGHIGVTNAVIKFCLDNNLTVDVIPPCYDSKGFQVGAAGWWLQKGE